MIPIKGRYLKGFKLYNIKKETSTILQFNISSTQITEMEIWM